MLSAAVGVHPRLESDAPEWLRQELAKSDLGSQGAKVYRGFAWTNAGGPRYGSGYLILAGDMYSFAREGLFRNSLRTLGPAESLSIESGTMCDTVVSNDADQTAEMRVCLAKHWGAVFRSEFLSSPAPGAAEST
jgi:hypothetical protein